MKKLTLLSLVILLSSAITPAQVYQKEKLFDKGSILYAIYPAGQDESDTGYEIYFSLIASNYNDPKLTTGSFDKLNDGFNKCEVFRWDADKTQSFFGKLLEFIEKYGGKEGMETTIEGLRVENSGRQPDRIRIYTGSNYDYTVISYKSISNMRDAVARFLTNRKNKKAGA